jgi:diacylglycerol kinase family enzyme
MPEPVTVLKILFVINPVSGGGDKSAWLDAITIYFRTSPHKYEWYEMSGDGDAVSLKHWLEDYGPDRVVAVGGDGTLKFLAEQLLYSGVPVAFLPAGSANGMASELCLPADPVAALKVAVEGVVKKMDVVCINNHISLHLSDIGLNAQLVKHFEHSGRRGMWGYAREVIKVLRRKEQIELELVIDGKRMVRKALMVVMANARLYGTGIAINPGGSVYDGRFEIVLLKRLSLFEIIKMIIRNRRFNKRKTEIISAERVQLTTKSPAYFQVDGEYIGEVTSLEAHIEKGAVDMVVGDVEQD